MLVWQRGQSNSDIFYSTNRGDGWSLPTALTSEGTGNRSPYVATLDTGFIIVWEKAGRIVSSRFISGTWTPPAFITPQRDTSNTLPQVHDAFGLRRFPAVVWEKAKPSGATHAIMYAVLGGSGLSLPDTIAWSGDNRRPESLRLSPFGAYFTYESNRTGHWEIYSALSKLSQPV